MENFNWRKMSKLTFPSGTNETQYLRFEENGTWTASDKEQVCVMTNSNPASAVAVLNAKMHPANDEDRGHSISSYQKLYDMAIEYIESHWDTLYNELIAWNTQYGDGLNNEVITAWDNCLAAAQRYGSYVSALNSIGSDIQSSQSDGSNLQVGNTQYGNASSDEDMIHAIIKEMYANSRQHASEDAAGQLYLNQRNLVLGAQLAQYGITAIRGNDGVWYVDRVGGERLYDKYKKYIYHTGGFAGEEGTVKDNEILAKLEKGEPVLTTQMWDNLTSMVEHIEQIGRMMDTFANSLANIPISQRDIWPGGVIAGDSNAITNVTNNNRPVEINMGDITVSVPSTEGKIIADEVRKITRDNINQIGRVLGIGR